jgi:hypothetical protein
VLTHIEYAFFLSSLECMTWTTHSRLPSLRLDTSFKMFMKVRTQRTDKVLVLCRFRIFRVFVLDHIRELI